MKQLTWTKYTIVVFCQTKPACGQLTTKSSRSSAADMTSIVMISFSCWRLDSLRLWTMTPPTIGPTVCASPKHRPTTHSAACLFAYVLRALTTGNSFLAWQERKFQPKELSETRKRITRKTQPMMSLPTRTPGPESECLNGRQLP